LKIILKYIISLLILGTIVYLTRNTWSEIETLKQLNLYQILIISGFFLLFQIINGIKLKIVLNIFKVKTSCKEWFGLITLRSLGNYLPLSAGSIQNSIYLKKQKDFSYTKFITAYSANIVILLFSSGIMGLIMLLINYYKTENIITPLLIIFLVISITAAILLIIPIPRSNNTNIVYRNINRIRKGWNIIKKSRIALYLLIALSVLSFISLGGRFYILFQAINYEFSFTQTMLVVLLIPVLNLVTILPGNLGIRESIIGGLTSLQNISFNSGFVGGVIDRIITLFWIFLLGIIFLFILIKNESLQSPKG